MRLARPEAPTAGRAASLVAQSFPVTARAH
jgi:hypothetical protein